MTDQYDQINVENLYKRLQESQEPLIIHVFGIKAFEAEHIPKSINAPAKNIDILKELVHDQAREIVIYDKNGQSSELNIALNKLEGMGYSNLHILEGGIEAWRDAGYALNGKDHVTANT